MLAPPTVTFAPGTHDILVDISPPSSPLRAPAAVALSGAVMIARVRVRLVVILRPATT